MLSDAARDKFSLKSILAPMKNEARRSKEFDQVKTGKRYPPITSLY